MYEEFFGLRERPFELTANPRFLVLTAHHREALSNLDYGIGGRKALHIRKAAACGASEGEPRRRKAALVFEDSRA